MKCAPCWDALFLWFIDFIGTKLKVGQLRREEDGKEQLMIRLFGFTPSNTGLYKIH